MVPPVAVAAMASLGRRRDAAAMMMVVVAFMSMGHRYSLLMQQRSALSEM